MKTTKLSPISFALILAFVIHLLMMYNYYHHSNYFQRYFYKAVLPTSFYLLLALFTFGYFVREPYLKQKKEAESSISLTNWWWNIYISGWLLLFFSLIEFNLLPLIPNRITVDFIQATGVIFIFKGIFLIPAHFKNKERENPLERLWLAPLFIIEMVFIIMFFSLIYLVSDAAPNFGE